MDRKGIRGKRVVMLAHTYYFRDARVQREAEYLASVGFEVHVVCAWEPARPGERREPREEVVNKVHLHHLRLKRKRGGMARYLYEYFMMTVLGMGKLIQLHVKRRFDAVHIHNMPDFLVLAGLPLKWTGATLILDVHDPMTELFQANYHLSIRHPVARMLRIQERISYRLADRLLTVNSSMVENVARKSGRAESQVAVVQNLPDSRKFPIQKGRRENWPFHKGAITLLYCGTVTEHYSLDIAVRAIARLSGTLPNLRLQILGDGNRLMNVLDLAKELGIADRVEHLKPVKHDMVIDIMAKADIGITTHSSGVFGNLYFSTKVLEFMSQGLPVISSRTYTIEKMLPESALFYFKAGDVDDLARQISFMCSHPEVVIEKTKRAHEMVRELNWDTEKRKLSAFYKESLKGGRKN